jgi:hypothetical protein
LLDTQCPKDNNDEWIHVGAGIIVYLAFGREAVKDKFPVIVDTLLSQETQWDATTGKKVSVFASGS